MRNERGFSMLELLVSSLVASMILIGLASLYFMTTRAFADSNSAVTLQRQGMLAMENLARQMRSASASTIATCNGVANSLWVTNPTGTFCYYAGNAGELCEFSISCHNLLSGGLKPVALMTQTSPPSKCPSTVPVGSRCFLVTENGGGQFDVAFAIADQNEHVLAFTLSVTCRTRNC